MTVSKQERERRFKGIRGLMDEGELDSLVIAGRGDHVGRGNIRYVTGYGPIVGQQYCVFPLVGKPVFIARNTPFLATLRDREWELDYTETSDQFTTISQLVSEFDGGHKVGIVDATWIFRQMRLIKSAEELENMRASASVADDVFRTLKELAQPGLSDFEIYGEVRRTIHRGGCEYSMELINSQGTSLNLFYPTGNRLVANGTLSVEITPAFDGYLRSR
jgi:Xaa-Pro aminopeptidase